MSWFNRRKSRKEAKKMKKQYAKGSETTDGFATQDDVLLENAPDGMHEVNLENIVKKEKSKKDRVHPNEENLEKHRFMLSKTLEEAVDKSGRKYNRIRDMPFGLLEGVRSGLDIEVYDTPENYVGAGGQSVVLKGKIHHNVASYMYSYERLYGQEQATEKNATIDKLHHCFTAAKNTTTYRKVRKSLNSLEECIKNMKPEKKAAMYKKWQDELMVSKDFQKIRNYVDNRIAHLFPDGECVVKFATVDESDKDRAKEHRGQIEREAKAIPGIQHPNLAYAFAQGKIPNGGSNVSRYFTVTEYVKEITMNRRKKMNYEERMGIGVQVLRCLEESLWSKNIIHRDLKPENILLYLKRKRNEFRIGAKLTDTGLLKTIRQETRTFETADFKLKGTLAYLSPERIRAAEAEEIREDSGKTLVGTLVSAVSVIYNVVRRRSGERIKEPTWKSDLYSLGATMYSYLTGMLPTEYGYIPTLAQHTTALFSGSLKMIRPSSTDDLKQLLTDKFGKRAKEVGEYADLVLAAMMHNDEDNRLYERGECEIDLESVMKGEAPEIILNHIENRSFDKDWYVNQVFRPGDKNFWERNWLKLLGVGSAVGIGSGVAAGIKHHPEIVEKLSMIEQKAVELYHLGKDNPVETGLIAVGVLGGYGALKYAAKKVVNRIRGK